MQLKHFVFKHKKNSFYFLIKQNLQFNSYFNPHTQIKFALFAIVVEKNNCWLNLHTGQQK